MNIYGGRRPELDALRGIAAMCVVIGHSFAIGMHIDGSFFDHSFDLVRYVNLFIHLVFDENAAVVIFFVLSGHVLGLQMDGLSGRPISQLLEFYVRRLTRIVPTLWVVVTAAFAAKTWLGMSDGGHYDIFLKTLLFQDSRLDGPLWTIIVEMGCSLVFPAVYWLKGRGITINIVVFVFLYIQMSNGSIPEWCRYIVFFQLGLLIEPGGRTIMELLGSRLSLIITCVAIIALCVTATLCSVFGRSVLIWLRIDGVAATVLIAYIGAFRGGVFGRFLSSNIAIFFGRISYGTYLVHFVLIEWIWAKVLSFPGGPTTSQILQGQLLTLLIVVPATVAIATLLHYFVEKPGITFGRVIASQFVNKATPITTAEAIPHRLNIP